LWRAGQLVAAAAGYSSGGLQAERVRQTDPRRGGHTSGGCS